MLSVTYTAALSGLEGYLVTVECSGQRNLPNLDIVGLPDMAVREARQRVKAAAESCGIPFPIWNWWSIWRRPTAVRRDLPSIWPC